MSHDPTNHEDEDLKNRSLNEALRATAKARGVGHVPPAIIPATSVGPSEYKDRMGMTGPATVAKLDLDGVPDFKDDDARSEGYVVRGKIVDRGALKQFLLCEVAAGKGFPAIVQENSANKFPSLFTIRRWLTTDPVFAEAYQTARFIRGERLGEQALDEALKADESNVKSAKLKYEALSRHAARLNHEYQDKQVVETKTDPVQAMPMQEAIMRLQSLLAIPEVAKQVKLQGLPVTIEAETPRIAISRPYEDPLDTATPIEESVVDVNFQDEEP